MRMCGVKMSTYNFVALFDIHWGHERIVKGDKTIVVPTHNLKALDTAFQFIEYFEPETIILGGDDLDAGEISHHNKKTPRLVEGFRLKEHLDGYKGAVIDRINGYSFVKKKVKLKGNHEDWLDDLINSDPALEGLLSINGYLGLKAQGWVCKDLGDCFQLGKLWFTHGELISGKYPADKALQLYHRNIRFGHLHTAATATYRRAFDQPNNVITAKAIPCLRSLTPGWTGNNSHSWINGFCCGTSDARTGNYSDQIIEMVNNKFYYNGILFDGTKPIVIGKNK